MESLCQNNLINAVSFRPSVEAMEEFKVQTGNFTAEYGMYSGAQVTMNLRSGSNDFHGTLFEFLRNDKLDARNYFEDPRTPESPTSAQSIRLRIYQGPSTSRRCITEQIARSSW